MNGTDQKPKEQNIAIPEALHRRLKTLASREGKKIKEIVLPPLQAFADKEEGVLA